jgi:twinfilin-like protein
MQFIDWLLLLLTSFHFDFHQLEIDAGDELTEDFLREELHPSKSLNRPKFAKPKGPANRGAKRLTKPASNGDGED